MKILSIISTLLSISCTSLVSESSKLGIQDTYKSYIPARTAVLSCQLWPSKKEARKHVKNDLVKETCDTFDKHILESFTDQNFMRGLSPKAVISSLEKHKALYLLEKFQDLWNYEEESFEEKEYYQKSLSGQEEWKQWLLSFSSFTQHSDAILIPFIKSIQEKKEDQRGLPVSKRELEIVLFLIDLKNAELIWISRQKQHVMNQADLSKKKIEYPVFPEWATLYRKIFQDILWKEYPGKVF